jgi:peptidoglycan/LPS O-acetylase OafA/YrhL
MSAKHTSTYYRPDIDGLRAIAVLSVIVFHIRESFLPGGFVGVDIFFVISGYLITYNIVTEMDGNRFSLADFYRRRIKRIAPAMIIVVASTVVLAQFLTIPEDAERTAESGIWALASLGNIYFWLFADQGYFAQDTKQLPLLHLWSLGVEEQFYLIWPLLLLLFIRRVRTIKLIVVLISAALGSYLLGQVLFDWSSSFVYYMLPTRAGELMAGAVLAIAFARGFRLELSKRRAELMGLLGLILMFGSLTLLSEEQVFPGFRAVPPTLGVALLILIGQGKANRVSSVLALTPLVWVGLLSYSAYLWHWPLLAFVRYGFGEISPTFAITALLTTFALSFLTYKFVEQPSRRSKSGVLWILTAYFLVPSGAVAGFCLAVMVTDGMATRPLTQSFEQMRPAYAYDYVCQRWLISEEDLKDPRCVVGASTSERPEAVLWGDSNAAHYVGIIGAFAQSAGFAFRNFEHASCPPLLSDPSSYIDARHKADCLASLRTVRPVVTTSDVLIISASWTFYQHRDETFLPEFFRSIETLVADGKQIILIGKAPRFSGYDRKCLEKSRIYPLIECAYASVPVAQSVPAINQVLSDYAKRTDRVEYFDVTPMLCPNQLCSPFDERGEGLYYDAEHISLDGSWRIGRRYIDELGVPAVFSTIGQLPAR